MRYLIDTNIFVYMASDPEYLNRNIDAIIQDPETLLYISAESVRELIVAYRNKGLCSKRWKSAEAMIVAIEKEFYEKPTAGYEASIENIAIEKRTYANVCAYGDQ